MVFIYSANPQSRPVVIIIFAHVVRPFVRSSVRPSPLFRSSKTKQQKTMVATGVTMGLAEWIIDDTCLVVFILGISQSNNSSIELLTIKTNNFFILYIYGLEISSHIYIFLLCKFYCKAFFGCNLSSDIYL